MNMRVPISALVGAIVLFAWQSLSWTVLPVHTHSLKYSPGQDSILAVLSANLNEEGMYYLPNVDPDVATAEDRENLEKETEGKPVAQVNYIAAYKPNMGLSMATGFALCLVVALVISLVLQGQPAKGFAGRWLVVLGFGVVLLAFDTLGDKNWWYHPAHWYQPEIVDYLAMFGLSGLWFAWYWGRKAA
ncbi:MAG: hypothetical protein GC205_05605 [Bacteroidetes bacterium]|nr:hypothetical protein [Bacteroidota bacterium]